MRCGWAEAHPLLQAYHDTEWGVLAYDRRRLFEFLVLEGAQAGLSWLTVLRRRADYERELFGYDVDAIARWGNERATLLMTAPGIIHHRAKIASLSRNARAFLDVEQAFGGFDRYLATITGGPTVHHWNWPQEVPVRDAASDALSRDLVRRGFGFVGPTICYSYLEAIGWVMDHLTGCFRFAELTRENG